MGDRPSAGRPRAIQTLTAPQSAQRIRPAINLQTIGSMTSTTTAGLLKYNTNLKADVEVKVGSTPHVRVHRAEWDKLMAGLPVEINPSVGSGFKVMSVEEWSGRWKRNEDFPSCEACASTRTKEHHFMQSWCRGRKLWEAESLCLDCHAFTYRAYRDPDFLTPEEWEKQYFTRLAASS